MTGLTMSPQLKEFAEGRANWHMSQHSGGGVFYAYRLIEPPIDGTMRFYQSAISETEWVVSCFADTRQVANVVGTYDEVVSEVVSFEKLVALVAEIQICKTTESARCLVTELRGQRLEFIRLALDLPRGAAESMRQRIVRRLCGARIDFDILSRRSVKW